MYNVAGGCHCGNVRVELKLSDSLGTYNPRACDCDFCTKHGAAFVADPRGALIITINNEARIRIYHQGSGTAEFLICGNCGVFVAVIYRESPERVYSAINARTLESREDFGAEEIVQPKRLSAGEKVQRWKDLWFSNVHIIY